ncbi:MAG: chemotaxis protein CheA [Paracoccaceae bacterium]
MNKTNDLLDTFFQECEDLLEALSEGLSRIESKTEDGETIHSVFRAVHSIKGGAGAFGFDDLVDFAHEFETILDEMRSDRLVPDGNAIAVLWLSADLLGDFVEAARSGSSVSPDRSADLIAKLVALMPEASGKDMPGAGSNSTDEVAFEPLALSFDDDDEDPEPPANGFFMIEFRPHDAMFHNGNEAAILFRSIAGLGNAETACEMSGLPDFDDLDPESSYLSWKIRLETNASESDIREIFEFVDEDCDLVIRHEIPDAAGAKDASEDRSGRPAQPVTPDPNPCDDAETPMPESASEIASPDNLPEKPEMDADGARGGPLSPGQSGKTARKTRASPTVRVDVRRVDRLINLVGELVVNQAMLTQCVADSGLASASGFSTGLDELKQLTREVQDSVMAIRAQPVQPLFRRMARIVRETAAQTGKKVRFETRGENTEVDKTVIEKLTDPLTHMVRNAVDHGLESPEMRLGADKPEEGALVLSAAHRSGRVVIDISDDGAGIDRDKVLATAMRKGLVESSENLSPEEIDSLLFMPGLSTVDKVSNLSGRGVGMDVVRTAIRTLGGRITISSTPGRGSTFSISLPLTLAVLDGMVVEVAGQKLVLPISSIIETLEPNTANIHPIGSGDVLASRGTFVPIVDVAHVLGFSPKRQNYEGCVIILVETDDGMHSAMLFDAIQDQRQLVIKALEENYGDVQGIAAATILGDGRIALILDPNDSLFAGGAKPAFDIPEQLANG